MLEEEYRKVTYDPLVRDVALQDGETVSGADVLAKVAGSISDTMV